MEDPLLATLRTQFGHESFRPGQREVIESVLEGRPTIAVLPTGGGKSLCFQLPAARCEGTALVLSPLIALMKDQVDALRAYGVPAAKITSADPAAERHEAEARLGGGELKLIYAAPERLRSDRFLAALERAAVSLVAVDEAHCVSEWGHDFRPDYRRIRPLIEQLRPPRLAAFTATATPEVREELGEALGMADPALFVRGFNRPNLRLRVRRSRTEVERHQRLCELVAKREGAGPALVYAATRKQAEDGAAALRGAGLEAEHYHAGLDGPTRHQLQERFLDSRCDALVATNAFGMGIDKADVRLLVHLAMPSSLEAYYQEVGRAGRDGEPADAVLLYSLRDARTAEFLIQRGSEEEELLDPVAEQARKLYREGAQRRLQRMLRFATGGTCRRRTVLDYFGDPDAELFLDGCGSCDRCEDGAREAIADLDDEQHTIVRKALSGVARTHGRVGRTRIAAMLVGSNSQPVRQLGFDRLSTFGLLKPLGRDFVLDLLDALEEAGLVRTHGTQYPVLALTERGASVMRDEDRAAVPWPARAPKRAAAKRKKSRSGSKPARRPSRPASAPEWRGPEPAAVSSASDLEFESALEPAYEEFEAESCAPPPAAPASGSAALRIDQEALEAAAVDPDPAPPEEAPDYDEEVYQRLVDWRRRLSAENGKPAYLVFSNATLRNISRELPADLDALAAVSGVGPTKLELYGEGVLEVLAG